jgi:antitoxin component YwqK of YwqJK toxin-antitoxin module
MGLPALPHSAGAAAPRKPGAKAVSAAPATDPTAPAAANAQALAKAEAEEPDWAKDYDGRASGDIETPAKVPRFVRSEWRANRYDNGRLLTEWEVRIADTGEAVRWGVYRRYYLNGHLAVLGAYRNGKPAGEWLWLDETGQIMRRARQQADYEDDLSNDPLANPRSQFRNPTGRVIAEGQLKQDKPHGLWTYYYDQGKPKAQGRYLTGLPDGAWTFFYPDGQVQKQTVYALGVPNGPYRLAYPGGQERERGQYNEGVRTGVWRTYYANGQAQQEGAYREDQRDGEWKTWDDTGRLTARTVYAQGVVRNEVKLPAPAEPPEPLVLDDSIGPPAVYNAQGQLVNPVHDWESPANASDAEGNPIQVGPPEKRPRKVPPLSRWTSPTGGEAKSSLP